MSRDDQRSPVFGYTDLQAKLVYDLRPEQQVSLSVVGGHAAIEHEDPGARAPSAGTSDSALAILAWRSAIGDRTVITQRVFAQGRRFLERDGADRRTSHGADRDVGYVVQGARVFKGGAVDVGLYIDWRGSLRQEADSARTEAAWLRRAAHVSWRRRVAHDVTFETGLRLAHSALVDRRVLDRWLILEWSPRTTWRISTSTGVMHQFPVAHQFHGRMAPSTLRPERASYVDIAVGRHLPGAVRWNVTLYARRERDGLWSPPAEPWFAQGASADLPGEGRVDNGLAGSAHGVEFSLQRRADAGISGWVGYAWGVARQRDIARNLTFRADLDQTHAVVASGTAPLPGQVQVGLTVRAGSNFPIPSYLAMRDGRPVASDRPNQLRLPAYARLDARVERRFGRHLVAFAEIVNVTNRTNLRVIGGPPFGAPGAAGGLTEPLFPRLFTGGVRLDLGSARPVR